MEFIRSARQSLHPERTAVFLSIRILARAAGRDMRDHGHSPRKFAPAFVFLYVLSLVMFSIAGWVNAAQFNLEAPLVALILWLVIANVARLRGGWIVRFASSIFSDRHRSAGATFPIALVLSAGPVAIVQATVISLITCIVIYFVGTRVFGIDKRLAAVLGVGGGCAACPIDGDRRLGQSQERASLYFGHARRPMGARDGFGAAVSVAGHGVASGRGRSVDRHVEFADAAGFAAATTSARWPATRMRRSFFHIDEGDRPRPLDRHLVVVFAAIATLCGQGKEWPSAGRAEIGGVSRSSSSAFLPPRY